MAAEVVVVVVAVVVMVVVVAASGNSDCGNEVCHQLLLLLLGIFSRCRQLEGRQVQGLQDEVLVCEVLQCRPAALELFVAANTHWRPWRPARAVGSLGTLGEGGWQAKQPARADDGLNPADLLIHVRALPLD